MPVSLETPPQSRGGVQPPLLAGGNGSARGTPCAGREGRACAGLWLARACSGCVTHVSSSDYYNSEFPAGCGSHQRATRCIYGAQKAEGRVSIRRGGPQGRTVYDVRRSALG